MSTLARLFDRSDPAAAARRAEPPVSAASVSSTATDPAASADAGPASSATAAPAAWLTDIGWGGQGRVRSLPRVSAIAAQRHATVFACCNVIAGDLAKVPLKLYRRRDDGREERVRTHPLAYLLNVEASPQVAAATMRYALVYAFCLRGRSYSYAPRDGAGELTLMEAIRPDMVAMLRAGRARFYDFEDGAGIMRRVPSRAMVHLRYMADDGWTGRSPIEVAAESMGLALAGQEAAARAAAGGATRGVVKLDSVYGDDEAYQRNARRVKAALSDPDSNGWPIISPDEDIKALDLSAADQQLLESRKFDREQIAQIYRVPPSKLQMLEHGVKANGEQQAIDYKADCLLHWGRLTEAQLMLSALTEAERRAGFFLRHDYDALLQATTKERYDALAKAIGGPWTTMNEGRVMEGMEPIEGGDRMYPPPNMTRDDTAAPGHKETEE
ncbi:phage portal protein [Mesobaculum littorinae]|uniref:Phage portal protein n=1 Tax=Mesobaculum littorinae TaxID=2486419 RepID=A0A438ALI6_9RHOB|nr:phage portal protein [Mesobaculum littorinae]RVV99711.1 phage portal protein [Mesobaculum littorinae]